LLPVKNQVSPPIKGLEFKLIALVKYIVVLVLSGTIKKQEN
jgi:hypothetical protein